MARYEHVRNQQALVTGMVDSEELCEVVRIAYEHEAFKVDSVCSKNGFMVMAEFSGTNEYKFFDIEICDMGFYVEWKEV